MEMHHIIMPLLMNKAQLVNKNTKIHIQLLVLALQYIIQATTAAKANVHDITGIVVVIVVVVGTYTNQLHYKPTKHHLWLLYKQCHLRHLDNYYCYYYYYYYYCNEHHHH